MSLFKKCFARIERAIEHSNNISSIWNDTDISEFLETEVHVDGDGNGNIWLREISSVLPQAIEMELGELLYQLRAALDGAVYACAVHDSGIDPPPRPSSIEFPICEQREDWKKQSRKIAALNLGRQRFIELMQPFEEPDLEPALRIANFNRALRHLNDLARLDRHRKMHTLCTAVVALQPLFRLPPGVEVKALCVCETGNLSREPLATFTLTGWSPEMTVSANPNVDLNLSLQELEPPCFRNDYLPDRLKSMVFARRMMIATLETNKWKEPEGRTLMVG